MLLNSVATWSPPIYYKILWPLEVHLYIYIIKMKDQGEKELMDWLLQVVSSMTVTSNFFLVTGINIKTFGESSIAELEY